jgi:hypothetical protein
VIGQSKGSEDMASNFKVSVSRTAWAVVLCPTGDFDGTSAFELLHLMNKSCSSMTKAVIQTDGLKAIYAFGRDIFWKNLHLLNADSISLEFVGTQSRKLRPRDALPVWVRAEFERPSPA